MAKYKLIDGGVFDKSSGINGMAIANSIDNPHWKKYQDWLSQGNTPDPADPLPPAPPNFKALYSVANTNTKKIDVIAKRLGLV